jgi:hypothetical protein
VKDLKNANSAECPSKRFVMISTTRKKQLNERTRKGNRIFNVRRNRRRQRRKKKRLPSRLTSSG